MFDRLAASRHEEHARVLRGVRCKSRWSRMSSGSVRRGCWDDEPIGRARGPVALDAGTDGAADAARKRFRAGRHGLRAAGTAWLGLAPPCRQRHAPTRSSHGPLHASRRSRRDGTCSFCPILSASHPRFQRLSFLSYSSSPRSHNPLSPFLPHSSSKPLSILDRLEPCLGCLLISP
jgi:hypothetical protein